MEDDKLYRNIEVKRDRETHNSRTNSAPRNEAHDPENKYKLEIKTEGPNSVTNTIHDRHT